MDIISHGLWGGVAFGRKSRKQYWQAFFFGIVPDLFSFGIYTIASVLRIGDVANAQRVGQHDMAQIPHYVGFLYNYTHSLIIFTLVFGAVWILRKKPLMVMLAWPLHILVDIPSHAETFFPTPFLWPISTFHINGISWGHPIIFFPNVILLVLVYAWWYLKKNNFIKNKQNGRVNQKN